MINDGIKEIIVSGPDDPTKAETEAKRLRRNARARANRRERDQVMRDLGLTKCRVNGKIFWE